MKNILKKLSVFAICIFIIFFNNHFVVFAIEDIQDEFSIADGIISIKNDNQKNNLTVTVGDIVYKTSGLNMTITGASTQNYVRVEQGTIANITIKDLSIELSSDDQGSSSNHSAFCLNGAEVYLTLQGHNTLSSNHQKAGLQTNKNSLLTIDADDNDASLTVQGGFEAAGIGGASHVSGGVTDTAHGGTIIINGGRITATGGTHGAGIGDGDYPDDQGEGIEGKGSANVIINGGVIIAKGGAKAAGIGNGADSKANGGAVNINGGEVTASSGDPNLAGIQSENVSITNATVNATIGRGSSPTSSSSITISQNLNESLQVERNEKIEITVGFDNEFDEIPRWEVSQDNGQTWKPITETETNYTIKTYESKTTLSFQADYTNLNKNQYRCVLDTTYFSLISQTMTLHIDKFHNKNLPNIYIDYIQEKLINYDYQIMEYSTDGIHYSSLDISSISQHIPRYNEKNAKLYIRYQETDEYQPSQPTILTLSARELPLNQFTFDIKPTQITIHSINGLDEWEFQLDDGGWSHNPTFIHLNPQQSYTLSLRKKATQTHFYSETLKYVLQTKEIPQEPIIEDNSNSEQTEVIQIEPIIENNLDSKQAELVQTEDQFAIQWIFICLCAFLYIIYNKRQFKKE